jgi:2-keto-3-deoxy-L-rhamnonate aldolase RhmA
MSPQAIELYGLAGLDFVIVGAEVESLDYGPMENLLRAAAASGIVPIVKIRRPDPHIVSDIMNFGGSLVMVPHVTSAALLEELVEASRFGSKGTRAECPVARYTSFGIMPLDESRDAANTANSIIPIIEDVEALDKLDEIFAVDGFDFILIGPIDLSRSLNTPERGFRSTKVIDLVEEIAMTARKYGKSVMTPLFITPEIMDSSEKIIAWNIEQLVARGVTLFYRPDLHVLSDYYRNLMPLRGVRVKSEQEAEAEDGVAADETSEITHIA